MAEAGSRVPARSYRVEVKHRSHQRQQKGDGEDGEVQHAGPFFEQPRRERARPGRSAGAEAPGGPGSEWASGAWPAGPPREERGGEARPGEGSRGSRGRARGRPAGIGAAPSPEPSREVDGLRSGSTASSWQARREPGRAPSPSLGCQSSRTSERAQGLQQQQTRKLVGSLGLHLRKLV